MIDIKENEIRLQNNESVNFVFRSRLIHNLPFTISDLSHFPAIEHNEDRKFKQQ